MDVKIIRLQRAAQEGLERESVSLVLSGLLDAGVEQSGRKLDMCLEFQREIRATDLYLGALSLYMEIDVFKRNLMIQESLDR